MRTIWNPWGVKMSLLGVHREDIVWGEYYHIVKFTFHIHQYPAPLAKVQDLINIPVITDFTQVLSVWFLLFHNLSTNPKVAPLKVFHTWNTPILQKFKAASQIPALCSHFLPMCHSTISSLWLISFGAFSSNLASTGLCYHTVLDSWV